MLNHTSLCWKSAGANIGLPALRCSWGVACVRAWVWQKKLSWSVVSVTWRCVWNKHVKRLPHQGTVVRTSGATSLRKSWASKRYVSKRNWKFSIFHIITIYNYKLKILNWFLEHMHNYLSRFPKKCRLIHNLILFGSRNINVFCKTCTKI